MLISDAKVARMVAVFAVPPAVVAGLLAWLVGGPLAAVVAFVVVAAALAAWARFAGDRRVSSQLQGRLADPHRDARLCNLVEGLSITAGVRQPRTVVIDAPGLNVLAAGSEPSKAILAVTTGLLDGLARIELEAMLAEALVQIRRGETTAPTVAAGTFGIGRRLSARGDRDALADQAAVTLTRYPPALAAALGKIEEKGSEVPGQPAYMARLWLADPSPGGTPDPGRLALRERIEALREL